MEQYGAVSSEKHKSKNTEMKARYITHRPHVHTHDRKQLSVSNGGFTACTAHRTKAGPSKPGYPVVAYIRVARTEWLTPNT